MPVLPPSVEYLASTPLEICPRLGAVAAAARVSPGQAEDGTEAEKEKFLSKAAILSAAWLLTYSSCLYGSYVLTVVAEKYKISLGQLAVLL